VPAVARTIRRPSRRTAAASGGCLSIARNPVYSVSNRGDAAAGRRQLTHETLDDGQLRRALLIPRHGGNTCKLPSNSLSNSAVYLPAAGVRRSSILMAIPLPATSVKSATGQNAVGPFLACAGSLPPAAAENLAADSAGSLPMSTLGNAAAAGSPLDSSKAFPTADPDTHGSPRKASTAGLTGRSRTFAFEDAASSHLPLNQSLPMAALMSLAGSGLIPAERLDGSSLRTMLEDSLLASGLEDAANFLPTFAGNRTMELLVGSVGLPHAAALENAAK